MRPLYPLFALALAVGCSPQAPGPADPSLKEKFIDARKGFKTNLLRKDAVRGPVDPPPPDLVDLVRYESPIGKMAAYIGKPPAAGKKHPAILWLVGGFSNGISAIAWTDQPEELDQSAAAYRKAGIVMMYPSLRGGNDSPGQREGFYGEVDDVLAAAEHLSKVEHVDPTRIYLGGHSTGGTLALLVAAASGRFRAVFAFGPADEAAGYGPMNVPFNVGDAQERRMRAPMRWMHCVTSPTFIIEGEEDGGNVEALEALRRASAGMKNVHAVRVKGPDHFSILGPANKLIAKKVMADTGPECNIHVTKAELDGLFGK
jgi:dipeptidyl aminopeptidase/acylaminoacyl peptidase